MRRPANIATARPRLSGVAPLLVAACLCLPVGLAHGRESGPMREREPARAAGMISVDQAVSLAERRYKARVVRVDTELRGDRRFYVLRLLSEEGRVWTVRVDSATGSMK